MSVVVALGRHLSRGSVLSPFMGFARRFFKKNEIMESKNNKKDVIHEAALLPPIVEEYYDLCKWILEKVSKFQKDQKYILGTRLQNSAMDILEHILDAALSERSKKEPFLINAMRKLEHIRYHLRLSVHSQMMTPRSYAYASKKIIGIGQKLGAWNKSVRDV